MDQYRPVQPGRTVRMPEPAPEHQRAVATEQAIRDSVAVGESPLDERLLSRSALAQLPPIEYRIEHLVSRPATVLVVGESGVGKTSFVLSMAGCLAVDRQWMGMAVAACPVLWVVGEGANGLHRRLAAWEERYHDGVAIPDDRLRFLVKPRDLLLPAPWEYVDDLIGRMGAGMVVLDTLSTLFPEADETRDAARIIRRMSDVAAEREATVVLIHHTGWSEKNRARGGSQLEGNADEVLVLNAASFASTFTVTSKKVRDGENGQVLYLRRTPLAGSVVVESGREEEATAPVAERVVAMLTGIGDESLSVPQMLTEMVGTPRTTLYRAVRGLVKDQRVEELGSDRRHTYRLVVKS